MIAAYSSSRQLHQIATFRITASWELSWENITKLEADVASLKKSDPVKYYDLESDQAVMKLCKIEVK